MSTKCISYTLMTQIVDLIDSSNERLPDQISADQCMLLIFSSVALLLL